MDMEHVPGRCGDNYATMTSGIIIKRAAEVYDRPCYEHTRPWQNELDHFLMRGTPRTLVRYRAEGEVREFVFRYEDREYQSGVGYVMVMLRHPVNQQVSARPDGTAVKNDPCATHFRIEVGDLDEVIKWVRRDLTAVFIKHHGLETV